jgi:RHS repeat-associated protein
LDEETGFLFLNARYYDPALGTFISGDPSSPLSRGVGINRYAYAGNNPIFYSDPTGLWADDDFSKNGHNDPGADGRYGSSRDAGRGATGDRGDSATNAIRDPLDYGTAAGDAGSSGNSSSGNQRGSELESDPATGMHSEVKEPGLTDEALTEAVTDLLACQADCYDERKKKQEEAASELGDDLKDAIESGDGEDGTSKATAKAAVAAAMHALKGYLTEKRFDQCFAGCEDDFMKDINPNR